MTARLIAAVFLRVLLATMAISTAFPCARSQAQNVPRPDVAIPDPGDTVALDAGERAPWAGMLMRDADVFAIQSSALTCQLTLASERTLAQRILESRITQEHARTVAAEESAQLHDRLWRDRAEQLARELAAAQARASDIATSPWLWGAIGLVVGVAVSLAIALAVGG